MFSRTAKIRCMQSLISSLATLKSKNSLKTFGSVQLIRRRLNKAEKHLFIWKYPKNTSSTATSCLMNQRFSKHTNLDSLIIVRCQKVSLLFQWSMYTLQRSSQDIDIFFKLSTNLFSKYNLAFWFYISDLILKLVILFQIIDPYASIYKMVIELNFIINKSEIAEFNKKS